MKGSRERWDGVTKGNGVGDVCGCHEMPLAVIRLVGRLVLARDGCLAARQGLRVGCRGQHLDTRSCPGCSTIWPGGRRRLLEGAVERSQGGGGGSGRQRGGREEIRVGTMAMPGKGGGMGQGRRQTDAVQSGEQHQERRDAKNGKPMTDARGRHLTGWGIPVWRLSSRGGNRANGMPGRRSAAAETEPRRLSNDSGGFQEAEPEGGLDEEEDGGVGGGDAQSAARLAFQVKPPGNFLTLA